MIPADGPSADRGQFPTTSWTLIARIKSPDGTVAEKALEELCTQYHYPLYCYLRRRGCAHHDAQDVLHDFLVLIFRRRSLQNLDEQKGRLRGWLCLSLGRHFSEWRRSEAKRSAETADATHFERGLDFDAIEERYQREQFNDSDTPDRIFEREWAVEMIRHVIETLRVRYDERGRGAIFAALRPALESGGSLRGEDAPGIAARLGVSVDAVNSQFARLLREYREVMQSTVRVTVEHESEVDAELAYLSGLFRR
jgi:DNA-directed RNA polymerase specialized sigma24 family protein